MTTKMNYLLDKKIRKNRFLKLAFSVAILIVLIYFQSGVFYGLSFITHALFRPVLILGNNIGDKFGTIGSFFASKKSLFLENEKLKSEINSTSARISNYNSLSYENMELKEILGRKDEKTTMILTSILGKPNQSPYDTLVVDAGDDKGIKVGDMVFVLGNIPVGRIDLVYSHSSKVVLFSSAGEKTEVIVPLGHSATTGEAVEDIFVEAIGRGGGNFEILLPRDISLGEGTEVTLPGINPYVLGVVEKVISDPRDSFQKVLLASPVNIQELKFVQIESQK